MDLPSLSTIETRWLIMFAAAVVFILVAVIAAALWRRNHRTERLRKRFGRAEYDRSMRQGYTRREAEAGLDGRMHRVGGMRIQPLGEGDRARFLESWRGLQSRFVDRPAGAVMEADQLLGDVMTKRGYPVGDFGQRADDLSVDHPVVLERYRAAHEIALRQARAQASTEELRQAMVHYRTLFEELVNEPAQPLANTRS